jgi:DNA repair photolyase
MANRRPDLRFRAMATLARTGVPRLYIMPVLPGLTDGDGTLRALLEAAREAGCRETRWNLLFLRPGVRELFLARLTEEFPSLAARYRKLYARSAYVPREYRDEVAGRILARARAAGLAPPKGDAATEKPPQLALTW